jgi:hypothetical protein
VKNMVTMCAAGYLPSGSTRVSKPEFALNAHVVARPRFVVFGGAQPAQAQVQLTDIPTVLSAPFDERSP